ncbi:MAG: UpxY family transcription antiterminator [Candidatus Korobacteraceae bacterium]|jgi:transcription antitermination factor NusG
MFSEQQAVGKCRQPEAQVLEDQYWYALQTRARFERKICQQVQSKHQEAYVPVTRERRRWSDRSQVVEMPLFPGYVFVRAMSDPTDRLAVLQTNGAYAFVTFKGVTARIPDQQIDDLRRIESQNTSWSPYPFLKSGQRVRICGGCLDGLEGIFVAERGKKLVISIEPMERSIAIDVGAYDLGVV